jgi:ribosomal protein L11 methyltransferase
MPFLQLTLAIGSANPEAYEDALLDLGASSITLEDAADDPVLEPAPGTTPLWPTVRIKALFEAHADRAVILESLAGQLAQPLPPATFDEIADRIWEREWLKDFRPMRFGRRLWICPAGMRPDPEPVDDPTGRTARANAPANEYVFIDLDPGLAFGTGTHPTTALCLEWLDGATLTGATVIDYGCGSGVLAIAALKLGAKAAVAVDIDPQAIIATLENAQRNGVDDRLVASTVADMTRRPADVVLANILAEPLEQLAEELASLVHARGHVVLSGLLTSQAQRLATRYAAWFDMAAVSTREDWARLAGIKREPDSTVPRDC